MSTSGVDRRSLLDDSTPADYVRDSSGDEPKPVSSFLSQRNRRILIGGAAVLIAVVILAIILDYAFVAHKKGDDPSGCQLPAMPSFDNLTAIPKMPDPFVNWDGSRIATKEQWQCSRQLLNAKLQHWELGTKPPRPAFVNSTFLPNNSGILFYAGHDSSKVIHFSVYLQLPTVGKPPYPAMLVAGPMSLNQTQLLSLGVAVMFFTTDVIAAQNGTQNRGVGRFYELYGSNHSAGALTAWSWAASLILDELEHSGQQLIDPTSVGVTGCSRWGKGALVMGAFDERFALTVPQESGSGGIANWRISDWQGTQTQTLGQIVGENPWYSASLTQFRGNTAKLPVDHHSLIALVAPRGLLTLDNPDFVWLGNVSSWGGALAGRLVYTALGVEDRMGISQLGGHGHCALPYAQNGDVERYVRRFLFKQHDVNTTLVYKDREYPDFRLSDFVDWSTPALS